MATELTCVVVALAREAMYFHRWLRLRAVRKAPVRAWTAPGVLVVHSGMGGDAARDALAWAFSAFSPARVVSAGFCGALSDDLPVGRVLLPDEVISEDGFVRSLAGVARTGRLLSVTAPVMTPADRRRLRDRYDAVAVDMESAAVADACVAAGIPWQCVRAVSDGAGDSLPSVLRDLVGPGVNGGRLALAVLRRPVVAVELWRLARQSRLAALNLSDALQQLLDVPGDTA